MIKPGEDLLADALRGQIRPGADLLAEALVGHTQLWLGDLLGIDQSTVSLWLRRGSRPEPPLRTALRLLFGIPEVAWLTEDERVFLRKIVELAASMKPRATKPNARRKEKKAA